MTGCAITKPKFTASIKTASCIHFVPPNSVAVCIYTTTGSGGSTYITTFEDNVLGVEIFRESLLDFVSRIMGVDKEKVTISASSGSGNMKVATIKGTTKESVFNALKESVFNAS